MQEVPAGDDPLRKGSPPNSSASSAPTTPMVDEPVTNVTKDKSKNKKDTKDSSKLEPKQKMKMYISDSELDKKDKASLPNICITNVDGESEAPKSPKPSDCVAEGGSIPHNPTAQSLAASASDVDLESVSERDAWLSPHLAAPIKPSRSKLSLFIAKQKAIRQTFGSLTSGFLHVTCSVTVVALLFTLATRTTPPTQAEEKETVIDYLDSRWISPDENATSLVWNTFEREIQFLMLDEKHSSYDNRWNKRQSIYWQSGGPMLISIKEEGQNATYTLLDDPIRVTATAEDPPTSFRRVKVTSSLVINAHTNMSALLVSGNAYTLVGVIQLE